MNRSIFALPSLGLLVLSTFAARSLAQEWQPVEYAASAAQPTVAPTPSPNAELEKPPVSVPPNPDQQWLPEFLQRLPHPPDAPGSLVQPAALSDYSCTGASPHPYFEVDPLLDPPNMPHPGWFYSVEAQAVAPHIFRSLYLPVQVGGRPTDFVELPNRGLDWTVAPRVELGYNLPSGFGGFALSYRFLGSSGNAQIFGPDGLAPLHSRMDLNVADLDYVSREMVNNPLWTMRWRVGVRFANLYYDSTLNQTTAVAAAGSGFLQQHAYDQITGAGPHVALELTRQLWRPGLSILGRVDFSSVWAGIHQGVSAVALDPTSPSGISFGNSAVSSSQTSPAVALRLGVNWQPPQWSNVHLFGGYQYESWWNVGRFSLQPQSRGDLTLQGFILRAEFNY